MNIGYVRVSTVDQNEERQIEGLEKFGIDKWFVEKISGKDTNRPELKNMMEFVREGDTVYVHDFSRLARSTKDLLDIVDKLKQKGVHLVSKKEDLNTDTPHGQLILQILSAIYEFERSNMLERQREGIAIKKEQDKNLPPEKRTYKGRKAVTVPNFPDQYERYLRREVSKVQLAKELGVSRPTLDKLIEEYRVTQTD